MPASAPLARDRRATWLVYGGTALKLVLRFVGLGWIGIFHWYAFFGAAALHVAANLYATRPGTAQRPAGLRAVAVSQVLFVLAMLLQFDMFDGPVWMVGPAVLGIDVDYARWAEWSRRIPLWNRLAFVPVALSWLWLVMSGRKRTGT